MFESPLNEGRPHAGGFEWAMQSLNPFVDSDVLQLWLADPAPCRSAQGSRRTHFSQRRVKRGRTPDTKQWLLLSSVEGGEVAGTSLGASASLSRERDWR